MKRGPDKNQRVLLILSLVVFGMIGLSFASVPLYNLFCRVTGFGGTTQYAATIPTSDQIDDREVTVLFNADVDQGLPWEFLPEQRAVTVKLGEVGIAKYRARNISGKPIVGTSTYNVQPEKAGVYFNKVQCFCFTEQLIMPGETAEFPVTFFVDPDMAQDERMNDTKTITLSYSFFMAKDQDAALARTMAQQHAKNEAGSSDLSLPESRENGTINSTP